MNSRSEAVTHAELERYMRIAKDILLKNREFLERVTAALIEKETLLYSDIRALTEGTTITEVEMCIRDRLCCGSSSGKKVTPDPFPGYIVSCENVALWP